jgi:hypothetical protein
MDPRSDAILEFELRADPGGSRVPSIPDIVVRQRSHPCQGLQVVVGLGRNPDDAVTRSESGDQIHKMGPLIEQLSEGPGFDEFDIPERSRGDTLLQASKLGCPAKLVKHERKHLPLGAEREQAVGIRECQRQRLLDYDCPCAAACHGVLDDAHTLAWWRCENHEIRLRCVQQRGEVHRSRYRWPQVQPLERFGVQVGYSNELDLRSLPYKLDVLAASGSGATNHDA